MPSRCQKRGQACHSEKLCRSGESIAGNEDALVVLVVVVEWWWSGGGGGGGGGAGSGRVVLVMW